MVLCVSCFVGGSLEIRREVERIGSEARDNHAGGRSHFGFV